MNIQDAKIETGLVTVKGAENHWHIHWNSLDNCFYKTYANGEIIKHSLTQSEIDRIDWRPYHPKEEIRPSEAGELWEYRNPIRKSLWFTYKDGSDIRWICEDGESEPAEDMVGIMHGQGGWERILPPVNDGEVMVIEGVEWHRAGGTILTYPSADTDTEWKDLIGRSRMTMTLTIPKEKADG